MGAHASQSHLGEFFKKHGTIGTTCSVEVYGTVGPKCLEVMNGFPMPKKFYRSLLGYSRDGGPTKLTSSFGADAPFVLLCKVGVKEGKLDDYLAAAKACDDAVQANEP